MNNEMNSDNPQTELHEHHRKIKRRISRRNDNSARIERLELLRDIGKELPSFKEAFHTPAEVKSNIESYIGTCSIPVGLVGPLLFQKSESEFEDVFTNIATTEGALVASMNRGASAISACGGFRAKVERMTMLRAPTFCFENIFQADEFANWLHKQIALLQKHISMYSKRAKLTKIVTNLMGCNVDCKFYYDTGDAAGQNMTTICTWHCCLWIEKSFNSVSNFPILDFILDGNASSDKKVSHGAIANGRGISVTAECVIDEHVMQKKMKTSSKNLLKWFNQTFQQTTFDGMIGNNINVANTIAGIFTATGQDIACVHESAVGYLHFAPHSRGLYMSLKLPRLVIGTVGGGTGLPHQKESLELMGCYGSGKVERLAQLIAGFCLSLDLSTISAMVSNQFAMAHEQLGRNRPVKFLKACELNQSFIKERVLSDPSGTISEITQLTESNGIIVQLTSDQTTKYLGLSIWELNREAERRLTLLKSKATDKETLNSLYRLTGMVSPKTAKSFGAYMHKSEFANCHTKEIEIYNFLQKIKTREIPEIFGSYQDDERECYLILMEFLQQDRMKLINSELSPDLWSDQDLKSCIDGITNIHHSLSNFKSTDNKLSFLPFNEYSQFASDALEAINIEYGQKLDSAISLINDSWSFLANEHDSIVANNPKCVVHNDCNPRNIAITKDGVAKFYDWELASIDLPQRDIAELISFVLISKNITMSVKEIITYHLETYNKIHNSTYDLETWEQGFRVALAKFMVTRLPLYLLGNRLKPYPFIENIIRSIELIAKEGYIRC